MYEVQRKIKIEWSSSFAYAIGLIASDGNLSRDGRHISFKSAEEELVQKFKTALGLENKIGKSARGGEIVKKYFYVGFGDIVFYKFLNEIGLTPAKSKTIKSVNIPDDFFADFLRGLFDGDGTVYSFWDKRWPNSFVFKVSFASASLEFIKWLKVKLAQHYDVRGYIHKGAGVFNLEYVKGDSKKLVKAMYHEGCYLFLERKSSKVKAILEIDKRLGFNSLQKPRYAGVAQR